MNLSGKNLERFAIQLEVIPGDLERVGFRLTLRNTSRPEQCNRRKQRSQTSTNAKDGWPPYSGMPIWARVFANFLSIPLTKSHEPAERAATL